MLRIHETNENLSIIMVYELMRFFDEKYVDITLV